MQPRLKDLIIKEIQPNLKEKFGYKNLYMGPQISKLEKKQMQVLKLP